MPPQLIVGVNFEMCLVTFDPDWWMNPGVGLLRPDGATALSVRELLALKAAQVHVVK